MVLVQILVWSLFTGSPYSTFIIIIWSIFFIIIIVYFGYSGWHRPGVHVTAPKPNPDVLQEKLDWIIGDGSEFCKWRERKRLVLVLFGVSSVKRTRKANHPPQHHATQQHIPCETQSRCYPPSLPNPNRHRQPSFLWSVIAIPVLPSINLPSIPNCDTSLTV